MIRPHPWSSVVATLVASFLSFDVPAKTSSFSSPSYDALVRALARAHGAMSAAARTPEDPSRLEAARQAFERLPEALEALARDYQQGTLDGHDFRDVWRSFGGLLDPAAMESYRRFFKEPHPCWIPAWPSELERPRPSSRAPTSALPSTLRWIERIAGLVWMPTAARAEDAGDLGAIASAVLLGIAAIIQARMPEKVAKIQAYADIRIADINANTQKYMTDQTANTSKYLADQQRNIAMFQTGVAQAIAREQQENVNYRLDRQLAELRSARKDAESVQTAIREKEWEYNERRLRIAEEQAQRNFELGQEALKAQLAAAGLSSGFASSYDSGNGLTTVGTQPSLGGVGTASLLTSGARAAGEDRPASDSRGATPAAPVSAGPPSALASTAQAPHLLAPPGTSGPSPAAETVPVASSSATERGAAPSSGTLSLSELRSAGAPPLLARSADSSESRPEREKREREGLARLLASVGQEEEAEEKVADAAGVPAGTERARERRGKRPRQPAAIVKKTAQSTRTAEARTR